jgi:peptidoglycan/LPS O-acetylase OafA/YrhL
VSDVAVKPLRVVAGHRSRGARWSAAVLASGLLSLTAGWIHFAYVGSHWDYWWAYGVFFLATGVFQALLAPALLRWPGSWTALVGIAGNVAIIGMYLWSRLYAIPMGPHKGVLERIGTVDMVCTGAEVLLVGVLLAIVGPAKRRWALNALLLLGVALWALRLTNQIV